MMNFQDSDALGGLIEGVKARQAEDSTRINQENVLAQIAKQLQDTQFAAQEQPGKLSQQQATLENTQATTANTKARTTREQGAQFVTDAIRMSQVPGGVVHAAEANGVPQSHPIVRAYQSAWDYDQKNPPAKPEDSKVRQLQLTLARSDDKSIQAEDSARNTFERQAAKDSAADQRNKDTLATRERIAQMMANARMAAEDLRVKAKQLGNSNLEQYASRLMNEARSAEERGDTAAAQKLRNDAEAAMQQAIRLESAKGTAKEESEAARLYAITGGKLDVRGSGQSGAAGAAAGPTVGGTPPAAAPATQGAKPVDPRIKQALGANFDPNKTYEVGPDGTVYEIRPKQ